MNISLSRWGKRVGALTAAAAAAMVTVLSPTPAQAEPDYDQIGRQFSLVLQNAHFSRMRFNNELNKEFLNCFLQNLDPQHFIFSQEDVDRLAEKYGENFGDYLLTNKTTVLSQELYGLYLQRSLEYLSAMETMVRDLRDGKMQLDFETDRSIPRSRRKLPRAANQAELRRVWQDQLHDMVLSEVIRRDNITLLQALGEAGDLTIQARRDSILVIRQEGNVSKSYFVDLRSKDLLNSPVYNLKQNDIVYVKPNKVRAGQSTVNDNSARSISTWLSISSFLLSLAILIFN